MAVNTRFWYPTFMRDVRRLNKFLNNHQQELVAFNQITGDQLAELNALGSALNTIVKDPGYPKYRETR